MVRLNALTSFSFAIACFVSIPLWCDWMASRKVVPALFEYVSIPLWCDWMVYENIHFLIEICFNSSMVRLNGQEASTKRKWRSVSIPLWCDWMIALGLHYIKQKEFQFLYGAIEWTLCSFTTTPKTSFNSSMVRLNDFFKHILFFNECCFNSSMVRLNVRKALLQNRVNLFQFLYGAIEWIILEKI